MKKCHEKEDAARRQELFVPISGPVKFYPEEILIIDHPSFQRLRRMRQLGLAHLVYPGATHSRFEHSLGTVNVAQRMIDHINDNYEKKKNTPHGDVIIRCLDYNTSRFIRLAALLHDIGHVPFGHTLEDELNLLPSHDAQQRIERISNIKYSDYSPIVDDLNFQLNGNNYTLKELIIETYGRFLPSNAPFSAYDVLIHIICKPSTEGDLNWSTLHDQLNQNYYIDACKDIIGNTICADFLDYLFRDWYHIGKPLVEDVRLYQYMEVLEIKKDSKVLFLINVGSGDRLRHDALTLIMELLEYRYKLTETVLFHRTKLSFIALLDRCLLEIKSLYDQVGLPESHFSKVLENLLLRSSDDGLFKVLEELSLGGDDEGKSVIQEKLSEYDNEVRRESANMGLDATMHPFKEKISFVKKLIGKLANRSVCTQITAINRSDFKEPDDISDFINLYVEPNNRHRYLVYIESMLDLQKGSAFLYCPHDETMNAKIAKVNLLIGGRVVKANKYEDDHRRTSKLTGGMLSAQVNRFSELWATHLFIDKSYLHTNRKLTEKGIANTVLVEYLKLQDDPDSMTAQMSGLVNRINPSYQQVAARSQKTENFPNGMKIVRDYISE